MATNNDHQSSRRGATEVMQQKLELNTQSGQLSSAHHQPQHTEAHRRSNKEITVSRTG